MIRPLPAPVSGTGNIARVLGIHLNAPLATT